MNDQFKAIQTAIDNVIKACGSELAPRQLKAIEISKVITSYAQLMAKNCIKLSVRKKIFPKIDRRPIKRILRNQIKAQMALAFRQTQIQVAQIISQPAPKFQPGGYGPMGKAIADETGKEIISTNHEIITLHNDF